MGVWQQILVSCGVKCHISSLTEQQMSVIVTAQDLAKFAVIQGMYICSNQGQSWSAMTLDLAHAIIFCISA